MRFVLLILGNSYICNLSTDNFTFKKIRNQPQNHQTTYKKRRSVYISSKHIRNQVYFNFFLRIGIRTIFFGIEKIFLKRRINTPVIALIIWISRSTMKIFLPNNKFYFIWIFISKIPIFSKYMLLKNFPNSYKTICLRNVNTKSTVAYINWIWWEFFRFDSWQWK